MADLNFPQNPNPGDSYSIGNRTWIWNGSGWALQSGIISTNPFRVISAEVTTTTNSTSTNSGAIIVAGGGGFGGDVWANRLYAQGAEVVTTASIGNFGVSNIIAGTDTAVAISVGNVYTIWNTSTLQTVTGRGAVTSNALQLTNTTNTTSTNTGALTVAGSIGVGGNLNVGGNIKSTFLDGYVIVTQNNGTLTTSTGLQFTGTDSRLTVGGTIASGDNILENNVRVLTNVRPTAGTAISITSVTTSNGAVTFTINNEGVTSLNGSDYLAVSAVSGNVTLANLGVQSLTAGADLSVTSNTGTVTISNTSTLQSITNRGAITNNALTITNTTGSSTSTQGALVVDGGVGIGQNLNVGGTLNVWGAATFSSPVTFSGTATFVYSTNTYYTDNLIDLHTAPTGVNTEWSADDGKDIGLRFSYFNRTLSTGSSAALVLSNSSQQLEFFSVGTESNTGTFINATYGTFKTGNITLVNSQTINGTGATGSRLSVSQQSLVVTANGIGVNGNSYFANDLGIGNNLSVAGVATATTLAVSNTATLSNLNVTNASLFTGAVTAASSLGVVGNLNVTGTTTLVGPLQLNNTTNSAGTNSGALQVVGGAGIGGNVNVGGDLFVQGVINATVVGSISTATHIAGGTIGAIPYQTAFGRTTFINPGLAGTILTSQGAASPGYQNTLTLAGTTPATSTLTGAFITLGGAGIGKDLWVGGDIYTKGTQVITTATVNNFANQTFLFAGTDTAISTSTGNITVWNTSTLQSVTNRGSVTSNAVRITNTTETTSTTSGALVVDGGLGVAGGVWIGGNLDVAGDIRLKGVGLNTITGSTGTFDFISIEGTGTGLTVADSVSVGGAVSATSLIVSSTATINGSATVGNSLTVTNSLTVGSASQYSSTTSGTTSTTSTIYLDSFGITQFRTVKYLTQIVDTGFTPNKVQSVELLVFHDNNGGSTQAYLVQYAIATNTGELGTWDANYNAGSIVLQFTPNYTPTALTVKTVRTAITT